MKPTRGERNRNPGNIKKVRGAQQARWVGAIEPGSDPVFEEFETDFHGIRALAKTLLTYQRKHGLRTIQGIITRWAPGSENDTAAYARSVALRVKHNARAQIDLSGELLNRLVKAIIYHENGRYIYNDDLIASAIQSARET